MDRPSFLLRGFRRPRDLARICLGSLESEVMDLVWQLKETSVRDLQVRIGSRLTYTTLMTTLDRWHRKLLLERRKCGRAFIYTARSQQGRA